MTLVVAQFGHLTIFHFYKLSTTHCNCSCPTFLSTFLFHTTDRRFDTDKTILRGLKQLMHRETWHLTHAGSSLMQRIPVLGYSTALDPFLDLLDEGVEMDVSEMVCVGLFPFYLLAGAKPVKSDARIHNGSSTSTQCRTWKVSVWAWRCTH